MKKVTASVVCLLTCLFSSIAVAQAAVPTLASANWAVTAPHNLAKERPTRSEVEQLLGLGDTTENSPSLCSFAFADLRRNGTLSLVAASDSSGRGFCNDIEITDRTPDGFQSAGPTSAEIGQGENVTKLIKDIAGDGRLELVIEMEVGGYQGGAHCGLEWPVIFAWTGNEYADVSAQFKDYYRQRLAELKTNIAALQLTPAPEEATTSKSQSTGDDGPHVEGRVIGLPQVVPTANSALATNSYDTDCLKAEEAKTERFLGISRDAGMADAVRWSESDDPLTREFAATVFTDIGTPEALNNLKSLASDSDSSVAVDASDNLRTLQLGPISTYEVDTEQWSPNDN